MSHRKNTTHVHTAHFSHLTFIHSHSFTLSGEHLASASWATAPKSTSPNKITAIPSKQTTFMTFTSSSLSPLSGALTFVSNGLEIPMFIQAAFASPVVGPPTLHARVSPRPRPLHDFISIPPSSSPSSDSAIIEGDSCYWTLRTDPAKKGVINTLFVQIDDSLAAGARSSSAAAAAAAAAAALPAAGFMVFKIQNDSALEFRFDGDFLAPASTALPLTRVAARAVVEANGGW